MYQRIAADIQTEQLRVRTAAYECTMGLKKSRSIWCELWLHISWCLRGTTKRSSSEAPWETQHKLLRLWAPDGRGHNVHLQSQQQRKHHHNANFFVMAAPRRQKICSDILSVHVIVSVNILRVAQDSNRWITTTYAYLKVWPRQNGGVFGRRAPSMRPQCSTPQQRGLRT